MRISARKDAEDKIANGLILLEIIFTATIKALEKLKSEKLQSKIEKGN